ncbi:hypothetical protein [Phenylobacterium sp.]|jgi:transposase-like protein|uniref:terminase small subunit-like protein n=1 Tax=Phenylobacterium sp. TaxID=1871053 RepID=UPI002F3E8F4A
MRRYHPPYDLAAMQERVIERLEAGMTVVGVARLDGAPSKHTIYRWSWEDEGFARRMRAAQAWGQGVRQGNRNAAELFDAAKAQAFLARVRAGEPIRRLVRTKGWPSREALNLWKRMRPDFAVDLAAAAKAARASKPLPFPYDEATADRIVLGCMKGERLRQVLKAPDMPSWLAVQRWRAARPEFAGALRAAQIACMRLKRRARRRDTPQVIDAVEQHILRGGSLRTAARQRGMPNRNTLYEWMKTRPQFARQVALAEMWRDQRMVDDVLDRMRALTPETFAEAQAGFKAAKVRAAQLGVGRRGRPERS